MKSISIVAFLLIFIIACNETSQPPETSSNETIVTDTVVTDTVAVVDTTEMKIQIPTSTCYRHTGKKDTVSLKVEKFPNVVTGVLTYHLREKDQNNGEIEGVLKGDTLLAEYTFMSEGVISRRQVIFLIQNDVATEGYGEMEEKDGKMIFKENGKIDFTKGLKLRKITCEN